MSKLKKPDYDTFGYCIKCGKCMVGHEIIDGIYKIKLSGEYTTVVYKLNDGSQMRVAMCKHCANNLTNDKEERDMVMAKVWRGWQKETEEFSNWTEDKKKNYLESYSKKRIVTRSDNLPSDIVESVFKKYKEQEPKEINHIIKDFRDNEIKKIKKGKK